VHSFVRCDQCTLPKGFFPGKEARRFSETTVYALLFIGTLAALNFFAYRHPVRADLTQEKVFTLSEQSKALLSELRSPISIYAFVKGGQDPRAEDLLKRIITTTRGLYATNWSTQTNAQTWLKSTASVVMESLSSRTAVSFVWPRRRSKKALQTQCSGCLKPETGSCIFLKAMGNGGSGRERRRPQGVYGSARA